MPPPNGAQHHALQNPANNDNIISPALVAALLTVIVVATITIMVSVIPGALASDSRSNSLATSSVSDITEVSPVSRDAV